MTSHPKRSPKPDEMLLRLMRVADILLQSEGKPVEDLPPDITVIEPTGQKIRLQKTQLADLDVFSGEKQVDQSYESSEE